MTFFHLIKSRIGRLSYTIIFITLLIVSCAQLEQKAEKTREWMQERDKLRVLCTTEQVAFLVRSVGGEGVHICTLVSGQNDPHSYQMVKGDDALFRSADLIFSSGLMLEQNAGLSRYLKQYCAFPIGDEIAKKTGRVIIVNGVYDPHMWNDLGLWSEGVFGIAEQLTLFLPKKADYFRHNAENSYAKLQNIHKNLWKRMQEIDSRKRYFVTTHDAFNYFCRAYLATQEECVNGQWIERFIAPEGFAPESQISIQDIGRCVDYIFKHDLHTVFSEAGVNTDSMNKVLEICAKKGQSVFLKKGLLYSDTLKGGADYPQTVRHNVEIVAQACLEQ
jgi:manganese/zinc/iron transport system substrate-binding protein